MLTQIITCNVLRPYEDLILIKHPRHPNENIIWDCQHSHIFHCIKRAHNVTNHTKQFDKHYSYLRVWVGIQEGEVREIRYFTRGVILTK